ncbi:uncharacterized protein [Battus philenor]|uniref:uncharacterized protein isoform X1 n=1 Tax=Battus philenor TaxID=42288 RepID=UPI0035D0C81F
MSAESPRHVRSGGPLTVPSQPPSDRGIIDAVSGFINDVTLSSSSNIDPKDVIQWARFETADINEPTPEGDSDKDTSPLLLILGYGSGVQVWLIPNSGDAQEVLSWRQGTVRVLRILPTPQHGDCFASKRPLIALCDSASPGPSFCSLSFISIRGGEQVKSIKFKNPILDVLANKRSVVVSFSERFAVFDAATLEDRLAVTTCYPCPCPLGGSAPINPLALGERWLAYAEKKLNPSKRSSGGCEGEGATSYTATVLHAAKSLSKGLRGLGESVAHSLAGGRSTSQSPSPPNTDVQQPGVITVLDIEGNEEEDGQESEDPCDPIVAHFLAHSEAIIALKFDPSGMLLVTADRRGHDFHVFRINPHPFGPTLASVHHLYILHRGDTTAKVQDIALSADSRWTAISTLRGTTHVFAISPYGGACGVRTHTQPRVVNRLSRFQRSAGLPIHSAAHAHSPVCEAGWTSASGQGPWYPNPRLPPFPAPTITQPLAQLRPTSNLPTHTITRTSSGRQRLSSLSEETSSAPLLARACFGAVPVVTGTSPSSRGAAVSLYLMAAGGSLLHLVLHPRAARNLPKEKICDESAIELEVEPAAQWPLQRPPAAADLLAPLPPSNPLLQPLSCRRCADMCMSEEERWLSQVEIVTHAGPHRRLWMGPQFVFKTYNCTGSNSSLSEAETVEVDTTAGRGAARSTPVNMPGVRPIVPVLIDSGSASSLEHSPSDSFRRKSLLAETGRAASVCDVQLREDLAEAMKEEHGYEREEASERVARSPGVVRAVDPLGTVVVPLEEASPMQLDPDAYTTSNTDEATFRPVVRAPASLPVQPDLPLRPLPRTTTIPVQNVSPLPHLSPEDALPLNMDVIIPAALNVENWLSNNFASSDAGMDVRKPKNASEQVPHKVDRVNVNDKFSKDLDVEKIVCKRDVRVSSSANAELGCEVKISLPKSNRLSDDIQPMAKTRSKKSPTKLPVSEKAASEISFKNKNIPDNENKLMTEEPKKEKGCKEVKSKGSKIVNENKQIKEDKTCVEAKTDKNDKGTEKISDPINFNTSQLTVKDSKESVKETTPETLKPCKLEPMKCSEKEQAATIDVEYEAAKVMKKSVNDNKNITEPQSPDCASDSTKLEDQAWDMLLNEPKLLQKDKPALLIEETEDTKIKTKKARKMRRVLEDSHSKDDDSFVEIHNIEDKPAADTGELVSISTPFEEFEPSSSYLPKSKKSRSPKMNAKDKENDYEQNVAEAMKDTKVIKSKFEPRHEIDKSEFDMFSDFNTVITKEVKRKYSATEIINVESSDNNSHNVSSINSGVQKSNKNKSPSQAPPISKSGEIPASDSKEVYVINTSEDDFPDIQITKGNKARKKSPQPSVEVKSNQSPVVVAPVKSWSTIAASKNVKKVEPDVNATIKETATNENNNSKNANTAKEEGQMSENTEVSLQEKLMELCKRTDIIVAECGAPSELNFVEEHHSVLHELTPLEGLEFGLDEFKLEVMKDSLLEVADMKVTSPICKINIDDILLSMKETANKVVDSNTFNLIDIEKVPWKKEKGFSVVETDKITSQEVKIDVETKSERERESEMMEKSSDDDVASPVLSTDSDKDEKKGAEASSLPQTLSKQSKSKKSRRKKK